MPALRRIESSDLIDRSVPRPSPNNSLLRGSMHCLLVIEYASNGSFTSLRGVAEFYRRA